MHGAPGPAGWSTHSPAAQTSFSVSPVPQAPPSTRPVHAGLVQNKFLATVSICRRGPGQTCALGQPGAPNNDIYAFAPPVPK